MYDGGEIIIARNVKFENRIADHASLRGRPCIIISEYNDKMTLLPISSKKTIDKEKRFYSLELAQSDIEGKKSKRKLEIEYIKLLSMFQTQLRYYDVVGMLKLERYYRLLNEIESRRLEKDLCCSEYYKEIYQDLERQREELGKILKLK